MSLNPNFSLMIPLQDYFVDKTTGAPLSAGVVTFYQDNNRSVLQPVYQLSGLPPYSSASYVVLPNPLVLSNVGTFVDINGNDIVPYLYPFDSNGNVSLYYITVYSSGGVLQFTREAWPNTVESGNGSINDIVNYVPNPQFLAHNNPGVQNATVATVGSDNIYYIAQGGWTFEKTSASTSTDTTTFIENVTPSSDPNVTANPRYYFQLNTVEPSPVSSDSRKDLCLSFPDVNKFAGDTNNESSIYTLSFQGFTLTGSTLDVTVYIYQYFGSGVTSPASPINAGTITLNPPGSPLQNVYNLQLKFGNNIGFTVGPNNDDYVKIAIRFPNVTAESKLTDFILAPVNTNLTAFPQTTNAEMISQSVAGWLPTPNPDGSDLYLPIVVTPQGSLASKADIGKIVAGVYKTANIGELLCDGTQYTKANYSSDGIPYSRLFNVLFDFVNGISQFGSGANFVNVYRDSNNTQTIRITTNKSGSQTIPNSGNSGFTINPTTVAGNTTLGYSTGTNGNTSFTAILSGALNPTATVSNAGSGLTSLTENAQYNASGAEYAFTGVAKSAAALTNTGSSARYFQFSNSTTSFYIWYQITNESDPTPGGTGIKVVLLSTMTAQDVASITAAAISSFQVNTVTCTAGSAITASSYFYFFANSQQYTVWYTVSGVGTQPVVVGTNVYIPVSILSTDANTVVSFKTQSAINSLYFAVPDLRGSFLRMHDPNGSWDAEVNLRFSGNNLLSPSNSAGTFELNEIAAHYHIIQSANSTSASPAGMAQSNTPNSSVFTTNAYGGSETRPYNFSVNFFIKY